MAHSFTGFICDAQNTSHSTPQIGVCIDTFVSVVITDTSGTPETEIIDGPLTTNGSNLVSGFLSEDARYETVSDEKTGNNPIDKDIVRINACVDNDTRSFCTPNGEGP